MDNATALGTTEEPKGALWRLQGIFFQPKKTFEEINKKPTWLIALIAILIIGALGLLLLSTMIGLDNVADQMIQQNPRASEMPEEQREMAISFTKGTFVVGALVGAPIIGLIVSLALMLAFWVAGSSAGFGKVFSVVVHSWFAYSVVATLLSALVVLLAEDPTELDVMNMVATHLGLLVDKTQSPVLFAFLSSLDILSVYMIFLLSLGMSVISRKSVGTAAMLIVILWLVYVLIFKVGMTALFT